jgi:Arc/MetJ family transcription regulator
VTFPAGSPLMVIMAYRSDDPQRPFGLLACANPLRAVTACRGYPWAWLPDGSGEPQVFAPGDAVLSVTMPAAGVLMIEAASWEIARGELARMLERRRSDQREIRGRSQSAAWYDEAWAMRYPQQGQITQALLQQTLDELRPAHHDCAASGCAVRSTLERDVLGPDEELPAAQREHYDGAYARVPRLSPDEALAMIDAAIEEARRS